MFFQGTISKEFSAWILYFLS